MGLEGCCFPLWALDLFPPPVPAQWGSLQPRLFLSLFPSTWLTPFLLLSLLYSNPPHPRSPVPHVPYSHSSFFPPSLLCPQQQTHSSCLLSGANYLLEQAGGWAAPPMRNEVLNFSEVRKIPKKGQTDPFYGPIGRR